MASKRDDKELLAIVNKFFVDASPVNKALGIKIISVDSNFRQYKTKILH